MNKLYLCGTYRELGMQAGKACAAQIRSLMRIFKEDTVPGMFSACDYAHAAAEFIRATGIPETFRYYAGERMEELEGVAASADVAVDDLILFNCLDELSSYSMQMTEKCTCIGIQQENGVYIAQNLDVGKCFDGYQLLLHRKNTQTGEETLQFTIPGLLGFTGVNRSGVAVVPNALSALACDWNGMPVTLVLQEILSRDTAARAAAFAKSTLHGAAQNYTIGDPQEMYSLECACDTAEVMDEGKNEYFTYLVHTNHPLKNTRLAMEGKINMPFSSYESTMRRLETAERTLRDADHPFTPTDIEALLSDHEHEPNSICRHGANGTNMTLGSVVYALGEDVVMYYADGPGCSHAYTKVAF